MHACQSLPVSQAVKVPEPPTRTWFLDLKNLPKTQTAQRKHAKQGGKQKSTLHQSLHRTTAPRKMQTNPERKKSTKHNFT